MARSTIGIDRSVQSAKTPMVGPPVAPRSSGTLCSGGSWLARQAQDGLAENVSLHLRAAGVDGAGARIEEDLGPGTGRVRRTRVVGAVNPQWTSADRHETRQTEDVHRQFRHPLVVLTPD